jgi:DnaJ-class molecular chaperone
VVKDPYQTLGVARTATPDEIRAAYRKLAKKHHPDLNAGDKAAEERFKAISVAYDLLDDPKRRARFDSGEIDAAGQPRMDRNFEWTSADGAPPRGGPDFEDIGDIFHEFLGGYRSARGRAGPQQRGTRFAVKGADVKYTMDVDFLDAAQGAKKRVTMHDGRVLDITIPKGLKDGQTLRLKGQGLAGGFGGEPGDALVEMRVRLHPMFKREGDDIKIEVPVSLREAVLGAKIDVPTIHGPVSVTIPKHSNTGLTLRLKGKGINDGDAFVTLKVMLPKTIDRELEQFLARWMYADYDPRKS